MSLVATLPAAEPTIAGLDLPLPIFAGDPAFSLKVNGAAFETGSIVTWGGVNLATTFRSATQLEASVPASLLTSPGSAAVRVVNAAGGASNSLSVAIAALTISSVLPTSVRPGGGSFVLTADGVFKSSTVLWWNATPLATTFMDSRRLTAVIPPGLTASTATASIVAVNPSGARSAPVVFHVSGPRITGSSIGGIFAGDPSLSFTVDGAGFVAGSVVNWNGTNLATTYAGSNRLEAFLPASLLTTAGAAPCKVVNPDGSVSNTFTVEIAAVTISSLSPSSVTAGGAGFTLTAQGVFRPGVTLRWNGTPLATNFSSTIGITATVPASLIASAGIASITATIPPSGATSAPVTFRISSSAPVITGSSLPGSVYAGEPAFRFQLDGSGFLAGSVVTWSGTNLVTTYVSATRLEAFVPENLFASTGAVAVKVVNPDGATSNSLATQVIVVRITSLSPSSIPAGSLSFTLTANGVFERGTVLKWNGTTLPTQGLLPNQRFASVVATLVSNPGIASITAVDPSGAISRPVPFEITSGPVIVGPWPYNLMAGDPGFSFTLRGANFAPGAVVMWGDAPLATKHVSASELEATAPASVIATGGMVLVKVVNPDRAESPPMAVEVRTLDLHTISPSSARAGGPAFDLTATGTFKATSAIYWNDTPLATTPVGTMLRASVPANLIASPGTVSLSVANPGGARSKVIPFAVERLTPALTSVNIGQLMAGDPGVTFSVSGSNFLPASVVRWNSTALSTSYVNATSLTASVPSELLKQPGAARVTVQSGGEESNELTIQVERLTISSISPATQTAGSAGFTLTATGIFKPTVTLRWNGTPLSTISVDSRVITAAVPASLIASSGTASVTVSRSTGDVTPALTFTISGAATPRLLSVFPDRLPAGVDREPREITISGEGFRQGAVARWNGQGLSTQFKNATQLTAIVPGSLQAAAGEVFLTVANPDGEQSASFRYAVVVAQPSILSITPQSAPAGGPAFTLSVQGADFERQAAVRWNGVALPTTVVNAKEVRAEVPAALIASTGIATITVVNGPGGPVSNAGTFTIQTPSETLAITRVFPSQANALIPEFSIKVTGTAFVPGSMVRWNGVALATSFANSTELTATVPPSVNTVPGAVPLVVVNPDGMQSPPTTFTVERAVPTITSMDPSSRMRGAPPFRLEIRGHGFAPGAIVLWNSSALLTTYVSYERLTTSAPGDTIGAAARISVINPGSESGGAAQLLPFLPWSFTRCSPSSVVAGGPSFSLTVSGENFQNGAVVRWSGTPLDTIYVDSNTLVATVTASLIASSGDVSLGVVQPDGAVSGRVDFQVRSAESPLMTIAAGGVVNAASSQASIAPGSLISIYASNLPAGNSFAENVPLPTELNGLSVQINGVPAPLLFAGESQINAAVPYEIPPGPATVVLSAGARASEPARIEVKPTGPAIFQLPSSNHAVAQNAADFTLNSAGNPARPGQYVILYLVGQGMIDPPVRTGAAAPALPLSFPVTPVEATIGGRTATVAFAGMAPGMAGVLQVNLLVPVGVSGELPVEIRIGSQTSPSALLSVAAN